MKNFKLKRVWVEDQLHEGAVITIRSQEKIHHLNVVLRIKAMEELRLFNETDGEWLGEVQAKHNKEISLIIKEQLLKAKPSHNIIIAFAPIKPDHLRFLIEKSTELGAYSFIPVITERTITKQINLSKLYSYAIGAAEQSERLSVPIVAEPSTLKAFLEQYEDRPTLFCNERSDASFIKSALQTIPNERGLIILIGPEGGFTESERAYLMSRKNIYPVSLGNNILRAETAAIFALSAAICADIFAIKNSLY